MFSDLLIFFPSDFKTATFHCNEAVLICRKKISENCLTRNLKFLFLVWFVSVSNNGLDLLALNGPVWLNTVNTLRRPCYTLLSLYWYTMGCFHFKRSRNFWHLLKQIDWKEKQILKIQIKFLLKFVDSKKIQAWSVLELQWVITKTLSY